MSGQLYKQRAQLESRAPLTLVTTLEIDDIPTVELTMNYDNGQKKNVKVLPQPMIWRVLNRCLLFSRVS
jgi:hypothetical protein